MIGFYQNFPQNLHWKGTFTYVASTKKLQQKFIEALHELNDQTSDFDEIACPTIPKCTISFEIGIAEQNNFNYIDKNELQKIVATTNKRNLRTIDLFWAIRYHTNSDNKKKPLKFDYYLARLSFDGKLVEVGVLHERGPRYVSPEELVNFLVKRLNRKYQKRILKPVENQ